MPKPNKDHMLKALDLALKADASVLFKPEEVPLLLEMITNRMIVDEVIDVLEQAITTLEDPYLGEDDGERQAPTVRNLQRMVQRLRGLAAYAALPDKEGVAVGN